MWSPYQSNSIDRINKVQNKFCKLVLFRCGGHLRLQPLMDSHRDFSVSFVYKLLNGSIDSPELLNKISLAIPSFSLRKPSIFNINFHSTNYGHATPLNRALGILNNAVGVDIFFLTPYVVFYLNYNNINPNMLFCLLLCQ